jgi:hypothetical protein
MRSNQVDTAVATIQRFADEMWSDGEPDQEAMNEACRALVQIGPVDVVPVLCEEFDQHELVTLTVWFMQLAVERGFGVRAGRMGRRGH